jgi:hypothetical protein
VNPAVAARLRQLVARLLYRNITVCFACGRPGATPCPGHEYGGTILTSRRRRFAPWWAVRLVDCRWSWPHPAGRARR